jgi:predicted ribosome quality control (RQC) complex YloA/Tae2 family protein
MLPALNWREIGRIAELASAELVGTHVDRVLIADRPEFPDGYLKNEWFLRLGDRRREAVLGFSVRPRSCYLTVLKGKGPKPSPLATRSPFDQALSKHLKGRRLTGLRALDRERLVVLEFKGAGGAAREPDLWLILALIPALPEAFLVDSTTLEVLARSRTVRDPGRQLVRWQWPEPGRAAPELELRNELVSSLESWSARVHLELRAEARLRRTERALRIVRERVKALRSRVAQGEEELSRASAEPEWGVLGEKLKEWLHVLPEPVKGSWRLDGVEVPCGEGRTPSEQLEKLFSLERRRKRRIEEASSRVRLAREALALLEPWLAPGLEIGDRLDDLERAAGVSPASAAAAQPGKGTPKAGAGVPSRWTGRTYFSKEGLPILVGRSREENLELTFKIARGNDIWMHVRGRPGAHLVIPLPPGKTASLETLLDAAQLVILHSGGKGWGKTEVDYTFKKYVKRIRDSSEASYVQNKTLLVAPDPARLERLTAG